VIKLLGGNRSRMPKDVLVNGDYQNFENMKIAYLGRLSFR
jgi:hypothetical protein